MILQNGAVVAGVRSFSDICDESTKTAERAGEVRGRPQFVNVGYGVQVRMMKQARDLIPVLAGVMG